MPSLRVKTRAVGASAVVGPRGSASVTSVTGGVLPVVTQPEQAGFSPIDMLYAALSSCLVLSARVAASRLGVLDRLVEVKVSVSGEKAHDEPSRISRFDIRFEITGDIDAATRRAIAEAAEGEICTVSNTLQGSPHFAMTLADVTR